MYSCSVETYRPRLRRTALRLVHNETDADDIVQEAFIRWFTAPPPDTRCPEAWLTTVVRRLCVDTHRARKKEQLCDAGALNRAGCEKLVDFNRPLELEYDFATVLNRLVERATVDECLALLMREGFGYTYSELARTIQKSEEACRQLVHRGKCAAQGLRPRRRAPKTISRHTAIAFLEAVRRCDTFAAGAIFVYLTASDAL
jgi:RNA polymerase sigma-70 factor, ECF subfamily